MKRGNKMKKWAGYVAITVFVIVLLSTWVAIYTTWRDCSSTGGTTVRGLFWLECINQMPHIIKP